MGSKNIYWGDIHNHNEVGYAKGSLKRSYDLAENVLDFYAFTPHTWWPDLPDNDEAIKQHHLKGFRKVKECWDDIKREVRERYRESRFVTLLAWEWHSLAWGDYCMVFPVDDDEFYYASNLDALKAYARAHQALVIPHHVAYHKGWRGLDWSEYDEAFSPVVEIFSEHGNSFEPDTHLGMYGHSMGGVDTTQTALHHLKKGRRFGFIAGTDDHYGYPGGHGYGLTAVLAEKLDRASIFEGIRKRHTYAATGDRMAVFFALNEGIMGDEVRPAEHADMRFSVRAKDRLKYVEIHKNGSLFKSYSSRDIALASPPNDAHLVRMEWGWDMIAAKGITRWKITLTGSDGAVSEMTPAFCGGAGSVTELNRICRMADPVYVFDTYTSRQNARPVNAVTWIMTGDATAAVQLDIEGLYEGAAFSRKMTVTKADLEAQDVYASAVEMFSSPKIKLHALIPFNEYAFEGTLTDEAAAPRDFYFLKVAQCNGELVWTSPVWMGAKTPSA